MSNQLLMRRRMMMATTGDANEITIYNGFNRIRFIGPEGTDLIAAFACFAISGDKIFDNTTSSSFNGYRWRGSVTLHTGNVYQYESQEADPRVFVTSLFEEYRIE